jgi:hypothetical protein
MSQDSVYRVADPQSTLECSLSILRGSNGGASAIVVELRNSSHDYDVVLKVNTEILAFIMLTVTDDQGTMLSKPARKFNTSEAQQFETVRIAHRSSHRWQVPIAAQLDRNAIREQGVKGRLVVNIALRYAKMSRDKPPADSDFQGSLLTLYDMNVLFTKAALGEAVKPPSADN